MYCRAAECNWAQRRKMMYIQIDVLSPEQPFLGKKKTSWRIGLCLSICCLTDKARSDRVVCISDLVKKNLGTYRSGWVAKAFFLNAAFTSFLLAPWDSPRILKASASLDMLNGYILTLISLIHCIQASKIPSIYNHGVWNFLMRT